MLLLGVSKMLALLDRVSFKKLVERLRVCVRTDECRSQNFSERGVGSGWRRGGMAEDLYVREDRRWYRLVVLVGGYLLV
jgi:hypothetical protein